MKKIIVFVCSFLFISFLQVSVINHLKNMFELGRLRDRTGSDRSQSDRVGLLCIRHDHGPDSGTEP